MSLGALSMVSLDFLESVLDNVSMLAGETKRRHVRHML
jgi:hypothetical protein